MTTAAEKKYNRERMAAYRAANPEKVKAYYLANRQKLIDRATAWRKANPERFAVTSKKYRIRHADRVRARSAANRAKDPAKFNARIYAYYQKNPWLRSWQSARQRCTNPNATGYEYYGGKGIQFHLTTDQCKSLWIRDDAYSQERPSLDRIDPTGHYTIENCRFIEARLNSILGGKASAIRKREANAAIALDRRRRGLPPIPGIR